MTDRLKGCVVVFDRDMRDDDSEHILAAIRMLKGVAAVDPDLATTDDWRARLRVRYELRDKIVEVCEAFLSEKR